MQKRQIVNIINFIRAIEPRVPGRDMLLPVKEQIRLMKEHKLPGTFLLQYDALILPEFTELLSELDSEQFEIGVWFETVQLQVEAAGLVWRGRFPWDWHTHCGFSVGYTKQEREKLVDVLYEKFKAVFGYYPKVFGSWLFDTHTARYVSERYGADAFCNCKEQYGTDGYTLWGGYYGQGYYPSRKNVFLPARNAQEQIDVPLFRMLGSDPVYQFDYLLDIDRTEPKGQSVISLEPAYPKAGACPEWVQWYMRENFNGDCLSFGYAQAGQENSFGWERMKDGILYQFPYLAKLRDEEKIQCETLGQSGRWYKETYETTPPSAITAHTAFDDAQKNSVWYCTKYYRVNLYGDHGTLRIRDIHILSDSVADKYEDTVCTENCAFYESLPFTDGSRYSGRGVLAGGYITYADGSTPHFNEMVFEEIGEGAARVTYGDFYVELLEDSLKLVGKQPFVFENRVGIDGGHLPAVKKVEKQKLSLEYDGVTYAVSLNKGSFVDFNKIHSENNELEFIFA